MFLTPALVVMAQAGADLVTHLSLHDGEDVEDSSGEVVTERQPVTWDNTDGSLTASVAFPGPVSATRIGYWSAAVGGTYLGGVLIDADATEWGAETGHDLELNVQELGFSA